MADSPRDTITLGVQAGDVEVAEAMRPYYFPLRKLLAKHCVGPYSQEVREISFVLRIDGSLWYWNFEGCEKLRLSKKKGYITIDVGVPRHAWDGKQPTEIREYLMSNVETGIGLMIRKIVKEKIKIDSERLLKDLAQVRELYFGD